MAEQRDWRGKIQVDFDKLIGDATHRENEVRNSTKTLVDAARRLMDDPGEDFNPQGLIDINDRMVESSKELVSLELDRIRLEVAKEEQASRWRNESFLWATVMVSLLSALVSTINLLMSCA